MAGAALSVLPLLITLMIHYRQHFKLSLCVRPKLFMTSSSVVTSAKKMKKQSQWKLGCRLSSRDGEKFDLVPSTFFCYIITLMILCILLILKWFLNPKYQTSFIKEDGNDFITLDTLPLSDEDDHKHHINNKQLLLLCYICDYILIYGTMSLTVFESLFSFCRYYTTKISTTTYEIVSTSRVLCRYSLFIMIFGSMFAIQIHKYYWIWPAIVVLYGIFNIYCNLAFASMLIVQYNHFLEIDQLVSSNDNKDIMDSVYFMRRISLISTLLSTGCLSIFLEAYNVNIMYYLCIFWSLSGCIFSLNFIRNRRYIQRKIFSCKQKICCYSTTKTVHVNVKKKSSNPRRLNQQRTMEDEQSHNDNMPEKTTSSSSEPSPKPYDTVQIQSLPTISPNRSLEIRDPDREKASNLKRNYDKFNELIDALRIESNQAQQPRFNLSISERKKLRKALKLKRTRSAQNTPTANTCNDGMNGRESLVLKSIKSTPYEQNKKMLTKNAMSKHVVFDLNHINIREMTPIPPTPPPPPDKSPRAKSTRAKSNKSRNKNRLRLTVDTEETNIVYSPSESPRNTGNATLSPSKSATTNRASSGGGKALELLGITPSRSVNEEHYSYDIHIIKPSSIINPTSPSISKSKSKSKSVKKSKSRSNISSTLTQKKLALNLSRGRSEDSEYINFSDEEDVGDLEMELEDTKDTTNTMETGYMSLDLNNVSDTVERTFAIAVDFTDRSPSRHTQNSNATASGIGSKRDTMSISRKNNRKSKSKSSRNRVKFGNNKFYKQKQLGHGRPSLTQSLSNPITFVENRSNPTIQEEDSKVNQIMFDNFDISRNRESANMDGARLKVPGSTETGFIFNGDYEDTDGVSVVYDDGKHQHYHQHDTKPDYNRNGNSKSKGDDMLPKLECSRTTNSHSVSKSRSKAKSHLKLKKFSTMNNLLGFDSGSKKDNEDDHKEVNIDQVMISFNALAGSAYFSRNSINSVHQLKLYQTKQNKMDGDFTTINIDGTHLTNKRNREREGSFKHFASTNDVNNGHHANHRKSRLNLLPSFK